MCVSNVPPITITLLLRVLMKSNFRTLALQYIPIGSQAKAKVMKSLSDSLFPIQFNNYTPYKGFKGLFNGRCFGNKLIRVCKLILEWKALNTLLLSHGLQWTS